jgi:hypothetical protein
MMATALAEAPAFTSIPEMKYQWSVFCADAIVAALTSVLADWT